MSWRELGVMALIYFGVLGFSVWVDALPSRRHRATLFPIALFAAFILDVSVGLAWK